jgi:hypothetical protein
VRGRGTGHGGDACGQEGERDSATRAIAHPPIRVPAIRFDRKREPSA